LDLISNSSAIRIAPFDLRAAVEAAEMTKNAMRDGDKKDPTVSATWAKIKFDRQIVAISKVEGVDVIYSTDSDVARHARSVGIECRGIADLPPAPSVQERLRFEAEAVAGAEEAEGGEFIPPK
jgi:hypothetical protein